MSDDRRKKSWREIDRQKDKSKHTGRDGDDGRKGSRDRGASSKYKQDLEKFFKSGGEVPDRFKDVVDDLAPEEGSEEAEWRDAVQELRDAEGFREFAAAVSSFRREDHRLPDDEELLLRMLDHPDERIVRDVLEHYRGLHRRRELDRVTPLRSRLSTIETMSEDPRTAKLVADVRDLID